MPTEMVEVTVPQLGVNDDSVVILEWYVKDGAAVGPGTLVCSLETSKAVFDVAAEASGFIVHLKDTQEKARTSEAIALIGQHMEALKEELRRRRSCAHAAAEAITGGVRATAKARMLALRLGLDLSQVSSTHGIIREQDVLAHHQRLSPVPESDLASIQWPSDRRPVVVYGAGKGALTVQECVELQPPYYVACFINDDRVHPVFHGGRPVFHSSKLPEIIHRGVRQLACAVGKGEVRLRLRKECNKLGVELINAIHPRAYISPSARLGKGNYIKSGAVIETHTTVGDCCIIDNGAMLAHDNTVGHGCHIAPGAVLGSNIFIGDLAIIGIGAAISTGVRIGKGSIISVGSSVTQDVPDYGVVEGVPGRVIGKRKKTV